MSGENATALDRADLTSIEGRYAWLRAQATDRRQISLGDGHAMFEHAQTDAAQLGIARLGADVRLGLQLLADRTAASDFEPWLRQNYEKPMGDVPWRIGVEVVVPESFERGALSIWKNTEDGFWKAIPLDAVDAPTAPLLSLAREMDDHVTASAVLSSPSVWAWLWKTFFSRIGNTGFAFGDLLENDEVERILSVAPEYIGPARFTDPDEVFFSSGRVSLWLGRAGGEWQSMLVLDHIDEVECLPASLLGDLQVPARRIELVRDRLSK